MASIMGTFYKCVSEKSLAVFFFLAVGTILGWFLRGFTFTHTTRTLISGDLPGFINNAAYALLINTASVTMDSLSEYLKVGRASP